MKQFDINKKTDKRTNTIANKALNNNKKQNILANKKINAIADKTINTNKEQNITIS